MNKKGFTLIETLIAIFLVTLAIVTFLGSAARGIQSTRSALNQSNAQLLAQEGIELVRHIRDGNQLSNAAWDTDLSLCDQNNGGGCAVDPNITGVSSIGSKVVICSDLSKGGCGQLYVDNGFYVHGGVGTPSPFRRIVKVIPDMNTAVVVNGVLTPQAYKVISIVRWNNGGTELEVQVVGYLTHWFITS